MIYTNVPTTTNRADAPQEEDVHGDEFVDRFELARRLELYSPGRLKFGGVEAAAQLASAIVIFWGGRLG